MANLESQPSSALNTHSHSLENTMVKNLKASIVQGDNQMSMQLYGAEKGPAMVSSNGIYTTQSSTTMMNNGKGGKRIPAYIKGIPTNQKQLESKKKPEAIKQSSSAFNLIQQRIKNTQAQQNEQYQTSGMNTLVDDYGQEDGYPPEMPMGEQYISNFHPGSHPLDEPSLIYYNKSNT